MSTKRARKPAPVNSGVMGTVYLLHFERPISGGHTTQHYLGWAEDLEPRLHAHEHGQGARLTQVARERGIRWQLARTWHGDRNFERKLKRRHESPRLCPICNERIASKVDVEFRHA